MCAQVNTPTPSENAGRPPRLGGGCGEAEAYDRALCRGVLYAALALGFRPPTAETLARITEPDAVAALAAAARVLDVDGEGTLLAARTAALRQPDAPLAPLADAQRRLFGHTARGQVPPYETEYGAEALFQQPQELGDLAGFVRAFGLVMRPEAHERIDHVSCECEFLSFLACKEAYAIEHQDEEMLDATVRATRLFLRDHLGRFAPAFAHRLQRADGRGFYGRLGALLVALVGFDCRRFGVDAGLDSLALRPDPAVCAAPMGCAADAGADGCGGATQTA